MEALAQPELYVEDKCTEITYDTGNPKEYEGSQGRIIKGK